MASDDLVRAHRQGYAQGKSAEEALRKAMADRIEELEAKALANKVAIMRLQAERDEALNQLDSARHSVEVLEANVARMQWALQELDSDPAITVAEHVQEYDCLAPFLPRSAAAVSVSDVGADLKGENQ